MHAQARNPVNATHLLGLSILLLSALPRTSIQQASSFGQPTTSSSMGMWRHVATYLTVLMRTFVEVSSCNGRYDCLCSSVASQHTLGGQLRWTWRVPFPVTDDLHIGTGIVVKWNSPIFRGY